MFKIREEQFSTFQVESRRQFALRVADFLRENIEEAKGEERVSLAIEIEPLLERAENHGFSTEQEMIIFVLAATYLGNDFDSQIPEIEELLIKQGLKASDKAADLEQYTLAILDQVQKSSVQA